MSKMQVSASGLVDWPVMLLALAFVILCAELIYGVGHDTLIGDFSPLLLFLAAGDTLTRIGGEEEQPQVMAATATRNCAAPWERALGIKPLPLRFFCVPLGRNQNSWIPLHYSQSDHRR
jgi:hypothetical protein